MTLLPQLVCFYYVLTTFTTVGYGKYNCLHDLFLWIWIAKNWSLNRFKFRGTCRILIRYFVFRVRWYFCHHIWRAGQTLFLNLFTFELKIVDFLKIHEVHYAGVLYFFIHICGITFRNHNSPGQRNCLTTHYEKERPGIHIGDVSASESKVLANHVFPACASSIDFDRICKIRYLSCNQCSSLISITDTLFSHSVEMASSTFSSML